MRNRKALLAIVAVVVVAVVGWLIYRAYGPPRKEVIKIGAILPLSGGLAYFGEQEQPAITIAAEKFEKMHPNIDVEIFFEDHKGDPKEGVLALRNLLTRNVKLFITQISSVTMALLPIIEDNDAACVTLAMHPNINASPNAIRIYASIIQESHAIAKHISDIGKRHIGIFYVNDVWGEEARKNFEFFHKSFGGTIAFAEPIEQRERDFRSIIAKVLRRKQVEGIYLATYGPVSIALVKQLREADRDMSIFGNLAVAWSHIRQGIGDAGIGMEIVMPAFLPEELLTSEFVTEYKKKVGKLPEYEAAFAYDATLIALEALRSLRMRGLTAPNGTEIVKEIATLGLFEGVQGTYILHKSKEVWQEAVIIARVRKDLSLERVKTITYSKDQIDNIMSRLREK
jgi:branched-chain amino acid transport system substrate-binding protein